MQEHEINNVLIFDIETDSPNPDKATCRMWGCYSFLTKQYHFGDDAEELQKLFNQHEFVVGHNIIGYDIPIVERQYNIKRHYKLKYIDTMLLLAYESVFPNSKQRYKIIGELMLKGLKDNRLPDVRLKTVMKHFNKIFKKTKYGHLFDEYKQEDFNYDILKKHTLTDSDQKYVRQYLKQDLLVTKNLYMFFELYFDGFRDFLTPKDVAEKAYINTTPGAMGYRILCNLAGVEPTYNQNYEKESYDGGFVALPTCRKAKGRGYAIDLNSAYPHVFMMHNLYTPTHKCRHKINGVCPNPRSGRGIFDKLKGTYCGCEKGIFETVIEKLYKKRLEYKKNKDERQYMIKIIINLIYGLSGSAIFSQVYDPITAADCTYMVRTIIKYCRKRLMEEGYDVLYGDTDSVYIIDVYEDEDKLNAILNAIVSEILNDVPFPKETFGLGFDDKFKAIFFFPDEKNPKIFKKKHYIYITEDDDFVIKGLSVIKRSASPLTKKILIEKLKPQIIKNLDIEFPKDEIEAYIQEYVEKDRSLLYFSVLAKPLENYNATTSLHAQISEKYGPGKHTMIRNKAGIGIGSGKSYCLPEEAKNLSFRQLDLDIIWNELDPFVKKAVQTTL